MKKIIITILLILLISILYSINSFAYYKDQYWECTSSGETSNGDAFGRFSQSFNNGVCTKSCCILCVSRSPIRDCFGGNANPMCMCSQASTDSTAPILTLSYPINNAVYTSRAVNFQVSISERSKLDYLDNNQVNKGYKLLCSGCTSFSRKVNFKEGLNDITMRASDRAGNIDQERIVFTIDSKKPQISKIEPQNNKYGNGNFIINYNENNLKQITLNYRLSSGNQISSLVSNSCESGLKKSCTLNPNLQDGEYYYSFEIEDVAGNKVTSKETKVFIDNSNPILNIDSSLISGSNYIKKLPLKLNVNEKVDLSYKDLNGNNKFVSLCKNCDSYDKSVTFKEGNHNLIIKATDKAGNIDEENFVFSIQK